MKVTLFARESRAKSSKGSAQLPLIICFRNGKMNLWQTTRLSVNPDWWDQDHQQLKSRMAFNPEMRHTPQWMMKLIDKCNNVFDIAKVFGPLVLLETNISRARNSQETESEDLDQSVQQSKGPKIH